MVVTSVINYGRAWGVMVGDRSFKRCVMVVTNGGGAGGRVVGIDACGWCQEG